MLSQQNDFIKKQYAKPNNLETRISIHKYGNINIWDWIWEHYHFNPEDKILEVGCGNGEFWKNNYNKLPSACNLTLTDISKGMIEACQQNILHPADYQVANIENLPFSDEVFDKVICHFMLYHASSQEKAVKEMTRVLKRKGYVGIITNSLFNMARIWEVAKTIDPQFQYRGRMIEPFCEENADNILKPHFTKVEKQICRDILKIDDSTAIINYIKSLEGTGDIKVNEYFYHQYQQYVDNEIRTKGSFNIEKRIVFYSCCA